MRKKNKIGLWITLAIVLVIVGVALKEALSGKPPIRVSAELAQKRDIVETVSASGRVQPEVEVVVSPDVSGEIVEMMVAEGDSVIKGQLLCRINPDLYNADLDRTLATLENTKASMESTKTRITQAESRLAEITSSYNRSKKLHDQKVISDAEWEIIQSTFNTAQADLEAAKQNLKAMQYTVKGSEAVVSQSSKQLNRTNVYAPMSGIISKRSKEKGERVVGTANFAGTDILKIADLNLMEVSVDVNENDIAKIARYDSANIEVDAYTGRKFRGYVTEIANSANVSLSGSDQVTNFTVKVRILSSSYADLIKSNRRYPFRPGMSASVDIVTDRIEDVLTVPIEAVGTRCQSDIKRTKEKVDKKEDNSMNPEPEQKTKEELQEIVFVLANGKAKLQKVRTGIQDDTYIQILEGITEKDEVITGPYQAVSATLKDAEVVKKTSRKDLFDTKKK